MNYGDWLAAKTAHLEFSSAPNTGTPSQHLFGYQSDLVNYALSKGRAAIFADTGLGKAHMLEEWARQVSSEGRVLIVAPLAVGKQLEQEAAKWFDGFATYARKDTGAPVIISNYEMVHHFDLSKFVGVVLDESSILKSHTGKFRTMLINECAVIPWRLACTATPAPNDHTELGNHSEWLGIKTRAEMLAEFFVHDGGSTQDWRLKGHAVDKFWEWVCRWGAMVKRPSDLGYSDESHILPPLTEINEPLNLDHSEAWEAGSLFIQTAHGLTEQRSVRRGTAKARAEIAARIANENRDESVLVWCEYNDEADMVTSLIPDAVQVSGSDHIDAKTDLMLGFADGKYRVLVSKPRICGFGMNFQRCARQVFLGPDNSYERRYQAIRRSWRFGQTQPVTVHTICSPAEKAIMINLARKHREAEVMADRTLAAFRKIMREHISAASRQWDDYAPRIPMQTPHWLIKGGIQ